MKRKKNKRILFLVLAMMMTAALFTGCGQTAEKQESDTTAKEAAEDTAQAANAEFTPGTYKAEAEGKDGTITVEVTFSETEITDIQILSQSETDGIGTSALDSIKEQVLGGQTLAVDAISGATMTSNGLLAAIEDAVSQAGGDVESLKNKIAAKENEGKTEQLSADVVVIGAGASGVSAAVSAADKGAKVILIEKTSVIGGASNLSWAGKFYNSSAALDNDVIVNVEEEIANWIVNNHWRVDSAAIRQYVTKSGETYDWLAEKGYPTTFINFGGEQLHMLPAYEDRQDLLKAMLDEAVVKNGGQVLTETTGKKLITNEAGDVIGVNAEKADGTTLEISATSVVLATGGYAANAKMVKELFGFEGINGGLGQNIGEGLEMAWEAGAKIPDNIGGQMLHQTLSTATDNLKKKYESFEASYPLMLCYLPNFMNVGPNGARFRDEAATLTAVAAANTSAFNGAYHMVIVSTSQLKELEANGMNGVNAPSLPGLPPEFYADFTEQFTLDNPWKNVISVFDSMVENGDGYKGNTIEELAVNAGMDVDIFTAEFENYSNAIATGEDTAFGKSAEYLTDMGDEGPYYAVVAKINNLGSVGGLLVNTQFKVLDDNRIPINGLYAVGLESEGVLFNDTYVGNGVGIGYSFTSGRLGGEDAAAYALQAK